MNKNTRNRGVAAILAMMFLVIFGSLTAAMAIVSQGNIRTATTYQRVNRSMATAETGVRFFNYRLSQIAATVTTDKGVIDEGLADQLWPLLRDEIINQMGNELHSLEPYYLENDNKLILGRIPVDNTANAPTFKVILERHPIPGENYNAPMYQQLPYNVGGGENVFTADGEPVSSVNPVSSVYIRVKSVGADDDYVRSVQMDFRMDKKIRFAIVSRNRVMIGKNVLIKGTVASAFTRTDLEHGHPVQMRDNFHGLDGTLDTWLDSLEVYLSANDTDGDNRVQLSNEQESDNLEDAESWDQNKDGFVDAYDMFLLKYDTDGAGNGPDGALSMDEFSASGELIDEHLWQVINEFKYPPGTKFDWDNLRVQVPGTGGWADASQDLSKIDDADDYAKIKGAIAISAEKASWEAGAADGAYQEFLAGPISSDPDEAPLTFEADLSNQADLDPTDFDVSSYKVMATGSFSAQVAAALPNDTAQPAVFTPPSIATIESVPFNSPHPYDYYERAVYDNFVFTNLLIPKGTNALFKNCKFVGVTFIESESDNTDVNYNYAGIQNADGSQKYTSLVAMVQGSPVTDTKPLSNNIRFESCLFQGVVVTDVPQEFTHVRNKLQFTGSTRFDLDADVLTEEEKSLFRKSTIMAPQYSVDMGTFTDPNSDTEIVELDGTIVTGIFDVRGKATIDGSVISTYKPVEGEGPLANGGNPASFNTTLGYFESAAGDGEGEIPLGGFGKIIIRYDPTRALPDGITGPLEVRPDPLTYWEGGG